MVRGNVARKKTGPIPKTNRERFEAYVSPEPMSGCHLWSGAASKAGYGNFSWRCDSGHFKTTHAHRISYLLENGTLPSDKVICHKCHNKLCVNPAHLYAGTQQDNINDELARGTHVSQSGRRAYGEAAGNSKLKNHQPAEIRRMHADGQRIAIIAKEYGVSLATIYAVVQNKIWKEDKLSCVTV